MGALRPSPPEGGAALPVGQGLVTVFGSGREVIPFTVVDSTLHRYGTVRTHREQIQAVLGVSRQLEAARLVLALPTLPAPRVQGVRVCAGGWVAGTDFTSRRCGSDPIPAQPGTETNVP